MDILFETLLETEWGLIIFGILILTAILFEIFKNKPKI